jgi:FkbM family methyltransferase
MTEPSMANTVGPIELRSLDKKVSRREAIAALAADHRDAVYPVEFRSQFGEDAVIWKLSGGQLDGFFIEAGAFDGYNFAATYALECLGWTGLLVEAIPERAEECRTRRTRSRVVHAALGATHGGEMTFTNDAHGGMFSFAEGAEVKKKNVLAAGSRSVRVPVVTLDELLRDHGGDIDAVVIDVEGSELGVLSGFDLPRHRPKILIVEDNSRGADEALDRFMADKPYVHAAWLKVNRVYVREDLAPAWSARLEG